MARDGNHLRRLVTCRITISRAWTSLASKLLISARGSIPSRTKTDQQDCQAVTEAATVCCYKWQARVCTQVTSTVTRVTSTVTLVTSTVTLVTSTVTLVTSTVSPHSKCDCKYLRSQQIKLKKRKLAVRLDCRSTFEYETARSKISEKSSVSRKMTFDRLLHSNLLLSVFKSLAPC